MYVQVVQPVELVGNLVENFNLKLIKLSKIKRYQRLGKLVAIAILLLALSTLLDIQDQVIPY